MLIGELIFSIIILILLIIFIFIIFSDFLNFFKGQPPFLPSSKWEINRILSIYDFKKNDKVLDLGSGDARILIMLAKLGIKSVGYEINPFLVFYSRTIIKIQGCSHLIKIHRKNYLKADFSKHDVYVIYGIIRIMPKLEKKLVKEAKRGTVVICNKFTLPTLKHIKNIDSTYLYQL